MPFNLAVNDGPLNVSNILVCCKMFPTHRLAKVCPLYPMPYILPYICSKSQAITHELIELLTSNFVCTLFSLCRINAVEENDQNLWDVMNDTIVVILADENMCVAL